MDAGAPVLAVVREDRLEARCVLSASPGANAADAVYREAEDEAGQRIVDGRELHIGPEVDVRQLLEQLSSCGTAPG